MIYEAHVKGLSMTHPDVPETIRGTYAAIGHRAIIDHLVGLGVTAIEAGCSGFLTKDRAPAEVIGVNLPQNRGGMHYEE